MPNKESIVILDILNKVCINFEIEGGDWVEGFHEHLPDQDQQMLREQLLKIHEDLKNWDGTGNGLKVLYNIYNEVGKSVKGVSGNYKALRDIAWYGSIQFALKQNLPMVNVTINQIKKELQGYVNG